MDGGLTLLGLLIGAVAVAALARRYGLSAPLILVVAGLGVSFIPGVPDYTLDPEVALLLFLPPLLYSAALESSYLGIRANLRPIGLLSVGAVLFTTAVVGLTAYWLIPGLGLPLAFALGAIVAPPDAVAATAIARRVGLPRRLVTILAGESLVNDATALTAYRVAVAAALGGSFSLLSGIGQFFLAAIGGIAIGLLVAYVVTLLNRWLRDPLVENTVALLTPFVAYLAAENEFVHTSGVLSVVVAGLFIGHRSPRQSSYASRLQSRSLWRMVDFLLESVVFALIGLQLRTVVGALGAGERSPWELIWAAVLVTVVVIVGRFIWVFPATYLPRRLSRRIAERDPSPPWQGPFVLSWAGMRGVVSLAAAFGLPVALNEGTALPGRDIVLFITFVVVIATLVLQGFTLPALIRRLGVVAAESTADNLAEAGAQQSAADAALARLDALLAAVGDEVPADVVNRLRERAELRALQAWERLGEVGPDRVETPQEAYRRLRREMLAVERTVFVELRDAGRIDDEVLRRVQEELDLEEAILARD
ncbi:MAG: Na+/H+ antiporter [Geodermatophilaceae bacterium]